MKKRLISGVAGGTSRPAAKRAKKPGPRMKLPIKKKK